jgi:hypothetical protein
MAYYRPAGQDFYFPYPVPDLGPFEMIQTAAAPFVSPSFPGNEYPAPLALLSHTTGLVGGRQRAVETWSAPPGLILKVAGGSDFYIAPDGLEIACLATANLPEPSRFNREILAGPALVLALALRGVWCLHASAGMYKDNVIVFLGESGRGKSTLAAYLAQAADWRLVADDILPVRMDASEVNVLPHFPQLKLPMNAQPGVRLPESLPLKAICVLEHTEMDRTPEVQTLSTAQSVQALLAHMAGTRMFNAALLTKHLEFSAQAAKQISAYRLIHPHRRDTLPLVREFLEKIC